MNSSKKIIYGILVLSVFVFIISLISLYVQMTIDSGDVCGCIIPLPFFIPFVGSTGLFIGTLVYYLFSPRFGDTPDTSVLMKLLSHEEATVLEKLIENNGELSQARLTSITGLPKVRMSRLLDRMLSRGMIRKTPSGKVNMITLDEDISQVFLGQK